MKRIILALSLFAFASQLMAFMPQYYETAEVTPGKGSLLLSVAPAMYGYGFEDSYWSEGYGANVELSFRKTINIDTSLALFGYAGGLIGTNSLGFTLSKNPDIGIWPNGGVGAQVEFLENPSLALQLSAEFPSVLSLTFLAGINSSKLNREVATFGLKSLFYYPGMAFITLHPLSNLHISIGASTLIFLGYELHAGLAYTF